MVLLESGQVEAGRRQATFQRVVMLVEQNGNEVAAAHFGLAG